MKKLLHLLCLLPLSAFAMEQCFDAPDGSGETPLFYTTKSPACDDARVAPLAATLILYGADVDYANNKGETPLTEATKKKTTHPKLYGVMQIGKKIKTAMAITPETEESIEEFTKQMEALRVYLK